MTQRATVRARARARAAHASTRGAHHARAREATGASSPASSVDALPESAGQRRPTRAVELERGQCGDDRRPSRKPGPRGERVDARGIVAERTHDRALGRGIGVRRAAAAFARGARAAGRTASSSRMSCAVSTSFAPSRMSWWRALRKRRMDRAGQREDLASLLAGEARGNERAGRERRLDDEHAPRESAHQPVAARKILFQRRRARARTRRRAARAPRARARASRLRAG